ncbi:MAG: hypothetical protein DMF97_17790 [Acidobacteria bacterium]|nr:MAG: hypothetical protein DMF97_17790 [Acidobacteriota bacterium]
MPEARDDVDVRANISWKPIEVFRDRIGKPVRHDPSHPLPFRHIRIIVGRPRRRARIAEHGDVQPVRRIRVIDDVVDAFRCQVRACPLAGLKQPLRHSRFRSRHAGCRSHGRKREDEDGGPG